MSKSPQVSPTDTKSPAPPPGTMVRLSNDTSALVFLAYVDEFGMRQEFWVAPNGYKPDEKFPGRKVLAKDSSKMISAEIIRRVASTKAGQNQLALVGYNGPGA